MNLSTKATIAAIKVLKTILGSRLNVRGEEFLVDQPTLFVCNHFTRSETLFFPYILYQKIGKLSRSLADAELFEGTLGHYLRSVNIMPTNHPKRNQAIIEDLITGDFDWVIYPEGMMVKNKQVVDKQGKLLLRSPFYTGMPKTGAAVLALQTQLIRFLLSEQNNRKREINQKWLFQNFISEAVSQKELPEETFIVPVNISYYPLRYDENTVNEFLKRLFSNNQIDNELQVEIQLLKDAEIDITFCPAISMSSYCLKTWRSLQFLPISDRKRFQLATALKRKSLTRQFMRQIYQSTALNVDHLFCFYLYRIKKTHFSFHDLRLFLYSMSDFIQKKQLSCHPTLSEDGVKYLLPESTQSLKSIVAFAQDLGAIEVENQTVHINQEFLQKSYGFNRIRTENMLKVIDNELQPFREVIHAGKKLMRCHPNTLKNKVAHSIYEMDKSLYWQDYESCSKHELRTEPELGMPQFSPQKTDAIGVVLCHGYKANPIEMQELAQHLNQQGVSTYSVRLKGHGTSPKNLGETHWEEWYDSLLNGLACLNLLCGKVYLIGFSTGGLLSLLAAARNETAVHGVVSINSALKLLDIRTRFLPLVRKWNELLEILNVDKGKLDYIDDIPEFPENYSRVYVKGLFQLQELMSVCENALGSIKVPVQIIQSTQDPVVNPLSANIIYKKLKTKQKIFNTVDQNRHVIVRGEQKEMVFQIIDQFMFGEGDETSK